MILNLICSGLLLRMIPLFDRREKGVHIDVEDDAGHAA